LGHLQQQPGFLISILALLGAGMIAYYLIQHPNPRSATSVLRASQPLGALNSGEERIDALTPAQRDHAPINKR
jgi:hypothetical protein